MSKIVRTLIMALCLLSIVVGAAWAGEAANDSQTAVRRSALQAIDFSAELDKLNWTLPGSELGPATFMHKSDLAGKQLSQGELRLGGFAQTGHQPYELSQLLWQVCRYSQEHAGQFPTSAVDLFPSLLTADGYKRYMAYSPEEQLALSAYAVNPVTGHFFSSFQSRTWSPGGLDIEPYTQQELLSQPRIATRDKATGGLPHWWHVTVYGEKPGTTLMRTSLSMGAEVISPVPPATLLPKN